MKLLDVLREHPINQWTVDHALVLDWYDGPLSGICVLAKPKCVVHFETIAHKYNEDDVDDRLYRWRLLPQDCLQELYAAFGRPDVVSSPLWIPDGRFETDEARRTAEVQLKRVVAARSDESVIVQSSDMLEFEQLWIAD